MKRILKKLTAILLVLALACGLMAVTAQAYKKDAKLVVLGDSIAAGEGASDPANAYAQLLAAEQGFKLANHAVPGHKSDDLLGVLAEDKAAQKAIREADIVNLSIGGNDLLASNVITLVLRLVFFDDSSGIDEYVESFRLNFAQIVKQIRKLNKNALFVVQTQNNTMDGIPLVGDAYDAALAELNVVFFDYLKENPGAYKIADVHSFFKGHGGAFAHPDRLHPSDAGHAEIARVVSAVIAGKKLTPPPADNSEAKVLEQIVTFILAAVDYLGYWLTVKTPWEIVMTAFRFMF